LLKQGISPEKLAQTMAAGFLCSMFPLLGTTSILNLLVGLRFRLNHPLMQTLNQLLGPLHVVLIVAYLRLGEWIWRIGDEPISFADIMEIFRQGTWREFFDQFGLALLHAITAWALTAPIFFVLIYFPCRRLFFLIARRRRASRPIQTG
jgi:uncharacterized protein (DUF2062 family)